MAVVNYAKGLGGGGKLNVSPTLVGTRTERVSNFLRPTSTTTTAATGKRKTVDFEFRRSDRLVYSRINDRNKNPFGNAYFKGKKKNKRNWKVGSSIFTQDIRAGVHR